MINIIIINLLWYQRLLTVCQLLLAILCNLGFSWLYRSSLSCLKALKHWQVGVTQESFSSLRAQIAFGVLFERPSRRLTSHSLLNFLLLTAAFRFIALVNNRCSHTFSIHIVIGFRDIFEMLTNTRVLFNAAKVHLALGGIPWVHRYAQAIVYLAAQEAQLLVL